MGRKPAADRRKITETNTLKRYYTEVPRLVWARCRNPFDLALWLVIKTIAGDDGECYLGRDKLAALAMMSAGQVSDSRKYLMRAGLLQGTLRRDPGYPLAVWHFTIPNFWKENSEFSESHAKIQSRIDWKIQQKLEIKAKRRVSRGKTLPEEPSPDDDCPSPSDGGVSPPDTKNI